MSFKTFIDKWINWGNSLPASPWQLAALFTVTVFLRNLMEAIPLGILFDGPAFLFHFPVAYVFPLLTLVFFMRVFSGYDTAKLLKIMVLAWTLTLLPPLIDGIIGHTSAIGYFPLERSNALWFLLNFFNPGVVLTGTTTGIRIEAAIGCLLAGVFTWAVAPNRRLLRGILNTLVFAPVFLSFFTWPYLVTIVFQPLFPGDGITHTLLQWHAGTEEALTGASHYITYLIDMIPVSFLSLWFLKELAPDRWTQLRNNLSWLLFPALSALTGTIAAFALIPPAGITFADTVTIAGTFMACLWITAGSTWKGGFRGVPYAVALTLAWSAGWVTFVLPVWRLRYPAFQVLKDEKGPVQLGSVHNRPFPCWFQSYGSLRHGRCGYRRADHPVLQGGKRTGLSVHPSHGPSGGCPPGFRQELMDKGL